MFKKTNYVHDERIITARRKINSKAFSIVYLLLLISVLVKSTFLELPSKYYITEFFIFLIAALYILITSTLEGIFISSINKKKSKNKFFWIVSCMIIIISLISIYNIIRYGFNIDMLLQSAIPTALISFVVMLITLNVFDKWSTKIVDKQIDQ